MSREGTIVIAVVLAFVLYLLVHRFVVSSGTRKTHENALSQTQIALQASLLRLVDEQFIANKPEIIARATIPDGWGRGVMAFEFVINLPPTTPEQLQLFRQRLNKALSEFTRTHNIVSANQTGATAFLITDLWQHETRVHLNVAFLINEATVEYINDLHKIDREN